MSTRPALSVRQIEARERTVAAQHNQIEHRLGPLAPDRRAQLELSFDASLAKLVATREAAAREAAAALLANPIGATLVTTTSHSPDTLTHQEVSS